MRRLASFAAWWLVLAGLWLGFVGTAAGSELVAGVLAAAAASLVAQIVLGAGSFAFRPERRRLARLWTIVPATVYDFGVVTWVLVRSLAGRRRPHGRFLSVPYPAGDRRAEANLRRALAAVAGTISPNGIVVELEPGSQEALVHALDPDRRTVGNLP